MNPAVFTARLSVDLLVPVLPLTGPDQRYDLRPNARLSMMPFWGAHESFSVAAGRSWLGCLFAAAGGA
jgi:hypothetical protein